MTGDITAITSGWPVLGLVAIVGIPAFFSWLNSRAAAGHSKRAADTIQHESTNNSGSTMKDSLDRIENALSDVKIEQSAQGTRIATLEATIEKRDPSSEDDKET